MENDFTDIMNQPIIIDAKALCPLNNRLRICRVVKINKKSVMVKQIDFENGKSYRLFPKDIFILPSEDLVTLTLVGRI
jgi:hypothetical protein